MDATGHLKNTKTIVGLFSCRPLDVTEDKLPKSCIVVGEKQLRAFYGHTFADRAWLLAGLGRPRKFSTLVMSGWRTMRTMIR